MKKRIFFCAALLIVLICNAQNPKIQPKTQLPPDARLTIKKDTTPTRFAVSFRENNVGPSVDAAALIKNYNLNATNISINASSITVNKTGLYHFDYFIHYVAGADRQPTFTTFLAGALLLSSITFLKDELVKKDPADNIYRGNWHFSFDVHITAPATLTLRRYSIHGNGSASIEGNLLGHLVDE